MGRTLPPPPPAMKRATLAVAFFIAERMREANPRPGAPALDIRDGTSQSPSRTRARRVDLLRRPGTPRGLRPRWLDASRGSAARDYAPSLRSPWRAASGF